MANTLRFKRGLVATIPTAVAGEPLFTTDTFDLYIGNGTTNTRFQKYIASGSSSQLLRGDGSLLTMPIVLTSPSNGQVLKYNGTNWVNDSDAGVTGSGTTNYIPKWTSGTALGNSNLINDASGNLGLGVTPSAWSSLWSAQQFGQAGSLFAYKSGSNYTVLTNNSYVVGGAYQTGDARYLNNGLSTAYIQNNSGEHLWMSAPSGTAGNAISFTQAMTLDASGNLGIATSSPNSYYSKKLVVFAGSEDGITIANSGTTGSQYLMFADGTTGNDRFRGFIEYNHTGNYMALASDGNERLRITSGGNVSIGNTNDTYKLDVSGTGRFSGQLTASTTVGGTSAIFQNTGAQNSNGIELRGGTGGTSVNWKIEKDNTVFNAFQLTPSTANGGTTYTTPVLTIANTGAATFSSSVTATSFIASNGGDFAWGDGSTYIDGDSSNQLIRAIVNNTERLRINSGGNLLVGTTADSGQKFQVNGKIASINSTDGGLFTVSGTRSIGIQSFAGDWNYIRSNGQNLIFGTQDANTLYIRTNDVDRLTISSTGAATFSGNVTTGDQILIGSSATVNGAMNFIKTNASPVASRLTFGTDGTGYKFAIAKNVSSTITDLFTLQDNGAATFSSTVTTAAPTGYAAKPYKLGEVLNGAVAVPTKSVAVEIDGTVYFLLASTTLP